MTRSAASGRWRWSARRRMALAAGVSLAGCGMLDLGDAGPLGPLPITLSPGPAAVAGGAPRATSVAKYTTSLPNGDPVDFYVPLPTETDDASPVALPVALLLQGANVEKSYYEAFASTVAAYGFVVVVPNHPGLGGAGLFAELNEIAVVLDFLRRTHDGPDAALNGLADSSRLVLLGHSFGGAAALAAAGDVCLPPFCLFCDARPTELIGVAVFGASLGTPLTDTVAFPLRNDGIPVLLVQGELDGVTPAAGLVATFEALERSPRGLVRVLGANHFGINDVNNPPGTVVDPRQPRLTQSASAETIGRWCAVFLRAFALADDAARNYLLDDGPTVDNNVEVTIEPVE